MLDNIFSLFIEVIKAAREGRFLYGNGADWHIVDHTGRKLHINTSNGTVTQVPEYIGEAHADWRIADRLVNFLLASNPCADFEYDIKYSDAVMHRDNSLRNGMVLHYNGGQIYFRDYTNGVLWVDISTVRERTTMHRMSALRAFQYLQAMGFSFENSVPVWRRELVA